MRYSNTQKKRILRFSIFAVLSAVILAVIVFFSARAIFCQSVRGQWENDDIKTSYTFGKHGELTANFDNAKVPVLEIDYTGELKGEYEVNKKDKTITITFFYYNKNLTQEYSYEINNKSLCLKNLEDADTNVFYKVKK